MIFLLHIIAEVYLYMGKSLVFRYVCCRFIIKLSSLSERVQMSWSGGYPLLYKLDHYRTACRDGAELFCCALVACWVDVLSSGFGLFFETGILIGLFIVSFGITRFFKRASIFFSHVKNLYTVKAP